MLLDPPALRHRSWRHRVDRGEGEGLHAFDLYRYELLLPGADGRWHSVLSARDPIERAMAAERSEQQWCCYVSPQPDSKARYAFYIDQSGTLLRRSRGTDWDQQQTPQAGGLWKEVD